MNKPATINIRLHALKCYADSKNLDVKFKYIKIQEPLFSENILTEKDYNKILSYLLNKKEIEWYIIFKVIATTGIRINESYQIRFSDLKRSRKTILGKGTKSREIWFPISLREGLSPYLKEFNPKDLINKHPQSYIRTKLTRIKNDLDLKCKLSPHEFRRFFARQVYKKSKDIYLIKDLLGHSSIKTTMRYLKVSATGVSRRISKIVNW